MFLTHNCIRLSELILILGSNIGCSALSHGDLRSDHLVSLNDVVDFRVHFKVGLLNGLNVRVESV